MSPIYLDAQFEGQDLANISKKMTSMFRKDAAHSRAFAFIIHDFTNPNIRKVILDSIDWQALHQSSGDTLTVFCKDYKPNKHERLRAQLVRSGYQYVACSSSSESPISTSSKIAEAYFDQNAISFPSILFFQVNEHEVVDSLLIELKEKLVPHSAIEIQEYFEAAIHALKQVPEESKSDYEEVLAYISEGISAKETSSRVKRVRKKAGSIFGLATSIASLG